MNEPAALRLLCALVMRPALEELAGECERATGRTLAIGYDSAGAIRKRVDDGEPADAALIQRRVLDALAERGKIVPRSVVTLARSGIALAVLKGAPRPDIGSADALKRALLAAGSIAYPDPALGHAGGEHFCVVLERLGIAKEVNAKAKLIKSTLPEFAAEDEAAVVVIQPMEILATPGYDLVGWLPAELQDEEKFTWAAAVTANAKAPHAAKTLIAFLASAAAAAVIKRRGMEPTAR